MTESNQKKEKLSRAPSWIMVGFVIGALFAYGVQRRLQQSAVPPAVPARTAGEAKPASPPPAANPVSHASLSEIENVFAQYGEHAVWRYDLTEVALWRPETNKYSQCFEVLRSGGVYYFRTIPHLTRPVVRPNRTPDAPLRFTEPEDEQLKRLRETSSVWLPPSTEP